eukprot:5425759-Alexandrium_andersonii.AAC.1
MAPRTHALSAVSPLILMFVAVGKSTGAPSAGCPSVRAHAALWRRDGEDEMRRGGCLLCTSDAADDM